MAEKLQTKLSEIEIEMKAAIEAKDSDLVTKLDGSIANIEKKMEEMELKMNRPGFGGDNGGDPKSELEVKAHADFLRKGINELTLEEKATMTVADDTTGGYLASEEMTNEIIKADVEISPIRSVAGIRTTASKSVLMPRRKTTPTALWKGETQTAEETNSTYGLERVTPEKLTAVIVITNEDLEDSDFNLEQEIISDAREQFEKAEGAAFVVGDGDNKPDGFLQDADVLTVESAAVGVLDGDDLLSLFYKVKTSYAMSANAAFLMNRTTLGIVRKLKDEQGAYLFSPAGTFADKPYGTINNVRVIEAHDMPDIANGSTPVAFGDWKRGYKIIDRKEISILRDQYTRAKQGEIEFVLHKRVSGKVVLPEALVKLVIKSS